jgi:competence ComEA-like helix-hairpin-helix protein
MSFKALHTFFKFSKTQQAAIVFLFVIIIVLQLAYFFIDFQPKASKPSTAIQQWLAQQAVIDAKKQALYQNRNKIYPFNPNFITDYKGYRLGMTTIEIDRLLAFRKQNKFANSPQEFQAVTKISDDLLQKIAPYFKFPDWVKNKKAQEYNVFFKQKENAIVVNINTASKEDLIKINGIGEVLANRILDQREKLGAFVAQEQFDEIWGLSPEVLRSIKKYFRIEVPQNLKKIDINNASLKELSQFYYFKNGLARAIIVYRSMNGDIKTLADLKQIKGFPADKEFIIKQYLTF